MIGAGPLTRETQSNDYRKVYALNFVILKSYTMKKSLFYGFALEHFDYYHP